MMLYSFRPEACWQRPNGGPLVIPTYDNPRIDESKESALGDNWITYFKKLNPDKKAYNHLVAPDWGPTKGFNKNGKLRFIHLVYPGPGNVVSIDKVIGGWGLLNTLSMATPPSLQCTNIDYPHLIHRVYGSNGHWTADALPHAPYVPILGQSRYIEMKWLWRIDVCNVACKTLYTTPVFPEPKYRLIPNLILPAKAPVTVTGVSIGSHGLWGTIEGGWIPLRYRGMQMTNWRI